MRVNFAKDSQPIGFFKVFQVWAGTHPASSGRTTPKINHRREEKKPKLKSTAFQIQRNMCEIYMRRKQTNSAREAGLDIALCDWTT